MTILTFIETLIHIFIIFESFSLFTFLWLLNELNSMILAASGATQPFDGQVAGILEAGPHGSFERSYMTS